jgi:hypothetical protein
MKSKTPPPAKQHQSAYVETTRDIGATDMRTPAAVSVDSAALNLSRA